MSICEMESCKERYVFEYTWLIPNFEELVKLNSRPRSSSTSGFQYFQIQKKTFRSHNGSFIWYLNLIGFGLSAENDNWNENSVVSEFHIEVACKSNFSTIFHEKHIEIMIDNDDISYKVNVKGYLNSKENRGSIVLFTNDQSQDLVNEKGDLTIVFRIIDNFSSVTHIPSEMQKLTCDYEKLLKSGEHSDFKIIVDKREFLVHKNILSSRSDYFAAMIRHAGTNEQDSNEVEIPNVRFEVMNELLKYIYCATVNITEDLMYDLLTCADMYQVDGLPEKCKESIIMHLKTSNVGECIVYAERYDNDYLREEAVNFLIKNVSAFSEDDEKQLKSNLKMISSPFLTTMVCKLLFKRNK